VLHGRGPAQWEPRTPVPATLLEAADADGTAAAGAGEATPDGPPRRADRPNPWATPLDVSAFAEPREADIVVLNYEIVEAHLDRLAERVPRAVVFDESHYCKQPTAKRTKAAMKLSKAVHPDGLRLALTGTPVLNQPRELTAQLRLIDRLKDFGSGAELARRFKGPESHDRLHWHLRARGFVRRLKQDVLPQLPAKRRVDVPLELKDPAEYRLAEKDVIAWLRTQPLDLSELDAKIAAALRAEQLVRMNHLRRLAARGKLPGALAWIESFLASGEALVVFAQHREVQEAVLERFPGALHILGDDSATQRDDAVRRFQAGAHVDIERPAERLIVCSMRAASQGITLTRASNVAFLELDWTPAMHDQAEDRCHRIGQEDAVTAWYLLCPGTIDDEMSDILQTKRGVIDAVVDGNQLPDEPVSLAVVRALRERGRRADGPAADDDAPTGT
jgi:SNF2 family DNA or RNA helicase